MVSTMSNALLPFSVVNVQGINGENAQIREKYRLQAEDDNLTFSYSPSDIVGEDASPTCLEEVAQKLLDDVIQSVCVKTSCFCPGNFVLTGSQKGEGQSVAFFAHDLGGSIVKMVSLMEVK
jgi:hypothetical protein